MKRIVFYLTGLLLFACSNAPMTSASVDAEEEWVYGTYENGKEYYIGEDGFLNKESAGYNTLIRAEYIRRALVYRKQDINYLEIADHPIPTLAFRGNRVEYKDSLFTIYGEKYTDRIYIEFTAPWGYNTYYDLIKRDEDYLKVKTTKTFLYAN